MKKEQVKKIRSLVADLISASGCSCCRDDTGWILAQEKLAKILKVPKDGSGFDFRKFKTKERS